MSYPNSLPTYSTKINKNASGWYVGPEYFNVPTSSPYELYLDHVPRETASTHVGASGGAAWTEVFITPGGGTEYQVDYTYGKVTFFSGMSGLAGQAVYYNLGDDIMAEHMNAVQDDIILTDTEVGVNAAGSYSTVADRLNAVDVSLVASGVDGTRIIDGTIRPGAVKSHVLWATNLGAVAPGDTGISTIQEHIDQAGHGTVDPLNPHGVSMQELSDVDTDFSMRDLTVRTIYSSGTYISMNINGPDADQYMYFWADSNAQAKHLGWDEANTRFKASDDLYVQGDISSSGHLLVGGMQMAFAYSALPVIGFRFNSDELMIDAIGADGWRIWGTDLSGNTEQLGDIVASGSITGVGGFEAGSDISVSSSGAANVGSDGNNAFNHGYFTTLDVTGTYSSGGFEGATGSFTTVDGKTVNVRAGLITSIA